jgi:hypothetical protein
VPLHLSVSIAAVFAQVLLVGIVYVVLLGRRLADIRSKRIHIRDIALSHEAYNIGVQKAQNNLVNQFELPVMLYICVALAAATGASNWGVAIASAAFVASRYVHAFIHVGSNRVTYRFLVFAFGGGAMAVAWVSLGLALLV